jgi:hypothetical protein
MFRFRGKGHSSLSRLGICFNFPARFLTAPSVRFNFAAMRMKDALDSMRVLRRSSSSGVHLLLVLFGTVISHKSRGVRGNAGRAIEDAQPALRFGFAGFLAAVFGLAAGVDSPFPLDLRLARSASIRLTTLSGARFGA